MKAKSRELLDRAVSAMVAAIEIYNKPNFQYRAETFSILAINGWELLLKAKWLSLHANKESSLFILEVRQKRDGLKSRKKYYRRTRSGNPKTHGIDYLGKKLSEDKTLDHEAWKNVEALIELRDCAVHFYNKSPAFILRLQEIGTACLKNFAAVISEWFKRDLNEYKLYLMPLAFVELPSKSESIVLNNEEKNFLSYVNGLERHDSNPDSKYSVTVNVEVKFVPSKTKSSLAVQLTTDPNAPAVRLTDDQLREKYPWDYMKLSEQCRLHIAGFKENASYHLARKALSGEPKYAITRFLDPGNPKSSRKTFFHPDILKAIEISYLEKP